MREIENRHLAKWTKLISYDVETNYKNKKVWQDIIPNGLLPEYTANRLTQNVPISATFNPLTHYDPSQYLTKLVLICHEVDDQFHFDMEKIFNVNKETKEVKKLERCYTKCQDDNRKEAFPWAAAHSSLKMCHVCYVFIYCLLQESN